jgi:hypothetical protein
MKGKPQARISVYGPAVVILAQEAVFCTKAAAAGREPGAKFTKKGHVFALGRPSPPSSGALASWEAPLDLPQQATSGKRTQQGPCRGPQLPSCTKAKNGSIPARTQSAVFWVSVDMCWTLVAEEPHRSTILNLEHCPLKANVSCLIFPLHQGKMSSAQALEWPRLPLTRESRATKDHTTLPQPPFSFPLYNRKSNARASRPSHL